MKNKSTRVRKFRTYAPVRKAGTPSEGSAEKRVVGVAKGYGPRSAENALEGTEIEKPLKLQGGTDDAPRRPLTKAELEKEEPELRDAIKGIPWREPHPGPQFKPGAGSPAESAMFRQLYDRLGVLEPEEQLHPDFIKLRRDLGMDPLMAQGGKADVRGYQSGSGGINYNRLTYGPGSPGATRSDLGQTTGSYDNRLRPGDIAVSPSGGFPAPGPNSYWTDPATGQTYHVADYSYISPGQPTSAGTWEQWYGHGSAPQKEGKNFWDYMNPWGGTTKGGSGSGVPTQKAVGTAVGTATNVFVPGLGYVTGPIARWITSKLQGGARKGDVGRMLAQAKAKGVDVTTGELSDMTGTGTSTSGGGQDWGGLGKPMGYFPYWQPGRTGSSSYAPFTGGIWGGGGTLAGGGIRQSDIRASGVTPRSVQSVGAPNVGPSFMGTSGPSNLTWGQIGGEGQDRPHFNPFFGGYNQNAPSKGVGVALRAKGDSDLTTKNTDTVPAMLTPREAVLNRNAAELAGRGNIEQLNEQGNELAERGVDLAGGKNMKAKKMQGGGYVPQAGMGSQPAKNPYNSIGAFGSGGLPDAYPRGGMPLAHGGGGRHRGGGGFYPRGMGVFAQGGTEEVPGPIGSPNPQQAYGPPITLTAPQLQQAAQKAGLSGGQIQGLMSAVQGFGQGYGELTGGGLGGGGTGGMDAAGAFQGGISDIGYPPFVAPQADYHGDKGGWIGRYDPAYTLPIY